MTSRESSEKPKTIYREILPRGAEIWSKALIIFAFLLLIYIAGKSSTGSDPSWGIYIYFAPFALFIGMMIVSFGNIVIDKTGLCVYRAPGFRNAAIQANEIKECYIETHYKVPEIRIFNWVNKSGTSD